MATGVSQSELGGFQSLLGGFQSLQDMRHAAFKKLIANVAEDLGREDVEAICFMYSMPKECYVCSALKILARLENDGAFSPGDVQPLQKLLEDIKRQDICSKHIEKYQHDLYQGRHYSTPASSCIQHPVLPKRANTCPSNDISSYTINTGHRSSIQQETTAPNQGPPGQTSTNSELEHPIIETSEEEVFFPQATRYRHLSEQMYQVGDVSTSRSTVSTAPWSSHPSSAQHSQENFLENSGEISGAHSMTSTPWYEQGTLKSSRSSSHMYTQSPHDFRSQKQIGQRSQSFRNVYPIAIQHQQKRHFSADETANPSNILPAGYRPPPTIPYSQSYPTDVGLNTAMVASQHSRESKDTLCASLSPTHEVDRRDQGLSTSADHTQQIPTTKKKRPLSGAKQKLQAVLGRSKAQDTLTWSLKRYPLCKAALKQKEKPQVDCSNKLELVNDRGPNPKLAFCLHPYGIEEDENKSITLVVAIEVPKKIQLHSSAAVWLTMSARAQGSDEVFCTQRTEKQSMLLRKFYVKGFLDHESLKQSHCKYVDIEFNAILKQ